jgi:hypothetical protein
MKHHKTRAALAFAATLGLAGVAIAVWVGMVQIPFHGGAGSAPPTLSVVYDGTKTTIAFDGLMPRATVPTEDDLLSWGTIPATFYAKLVNNNAATINGFTLRLTPTGTPDTALLAAIHYNMCQANYGAGCPAGWANVDYTVAHNLITGTLAELVATPRAFALPVFHTGSTMVLGLAFWLDKDAPQSVADKTVAGTLDIQTIN